MNTTTLRRIDPAQLEGTIDAHQAVDATTLREAERIVDAVRDGGDAALRHYGERFDALVAGAPSLIGRERLDEALAGLGAEQQALLTRTAERIRRFAEAQKQCLRPLEVVIAGGRAGHNISPLQRAGCYAPGGGYPLPSSVLMTAVTARVAGVEQVWVASPRPTQATLAAAAVAGADGLLACGGAQAIAALAYGTESVPAVDIIVGPGNRWVTAAKKLVAGQVAIDMLAGPSELVVLADASADPALIAADLLAQAEHADDALVAVISCDPNLLDAVDGALCNQLTDLPTAKAAAQAIARGLAVSCGSLSEAAQLCDRIAPEHLQLMVAEPEQLATRVRHYGALFIGAGSAEALGDYGAGPNHVLPTGRTARHTGGLSVLSFLRVRTWMQIDEPEAAEQLRQDAAALARLEGLEAHARAAEAR